MSTKQEEAVRGGQEATERHRLEAAVGDNVMRVVGRPPGLFAVQVRQVFGDNYRVNVFVGADAASAKVAHSYFVAADGDGKVIESTPALTRLY